MTATALSGKTRKKPIASEPVAEAAPARKIIAYKGFNSLLQCSPNGAPFQFEIGKSYEVEGRIEACANGFHACENPTSVFEFYPPSSNGSINRFCEVELEGDIDRRDTKIAARKITIVRELTIKEMTEKAVELTTARAKIEAEKTGPRGASSATGDYGASSATGPRGASSATGDYGASSATGDYGASSATGKFSAAMASGFSGKVLGAEGCALFLVERLGNFGGDDHGKIIAVWSGIVGQDGIKPNVFYTLRNGKPVEVME